MPTLHLLLETTASTNSGIPADTLTESGPESKKVGLVGSCNIKTSKVPTLKDPTLVDRELDMPTRPPATGDLGLTGAEAIGCASHR